MSGNNMDMPEMVWQHQYQKRWSAYTDEQNEILNKAANKWQKSVSLPSKDPKQTIVVYLDKMMQVNKVSLIEQKVRCLVYSDGFYSWLWEDDDGTWKSYKPRLVCFLEMAYQREEQIFRFFDDADYYVNLKTFRQVNEETNFARKVIREKVGNMTSGMFQLALHERKFKEMCSDPSVSLKKRCINLPSLSTMHSSMIANTSQHIDIPSPKIDDETDEEECDSVLPGDFECPEARDYHIYQEDGTAYSAILSYVSTSENKNKFHLIQLLQHNKKKKFAIWQRFGRVGTKGQNEFLNFSTGISKAKDEFEDRFYDKTGNLWQNRENFTHVAGKYDLLKLDLNPQSDIVVGNIDLKPSIQSLLELICNKKVMAMIMSEMRYDSTNAPLGQLTFRQIKDGYRALNKIAEALSSEVAGHDLVNACEEFYMKIPHNFGKKSPPIIQSKEDIEKKLEMLEALTNIRIAMKVLNRRVHEHPLNKCYDSFKYFLELLDPFGEEFSVLKNCLLQTHGPTHKNYKMDVVAIYSCHLKANSSFKNYGNNLLLWHGSRITNWVGILKNGLKIAPSEAPSTGNAFGKGLYFADISSKSANYCFPTKKNNEGLLLLCQVSLGNQLGLLESDETLHRSLPAEYDSVFGKGKYAPRNFDMGILSPEAKMPCGPLIEDPTGAEVLVYNEYVVYDVDQVEMKYLLRIKFHFK
ncbi:Poly [ADP-ribose] polymerase 2 [Araneus ventricosus]|uniref:Poly [ADP-ribose] polymerase n=1 Tax=Araneus ventricosus TaxID=182803 RepID=A0A4Y1ZZX8_ARAVE|nr:Poly [ADP-ribose] polymerase 2 [Araneus ventricosus]